MSNEEDLRDATAGGGGSGTPGDGGNGLPPGGGSESSDIKPDPEALNRLLYNQLNSARGRPTAPGAEAVQVGSLGLQARSAHAMHSLLGLLKKSASNPSGDDAQRLEAEIKGLESEVVALALSASQAEANARKDDFTPLCSKLPVFGTQSVIPDLKKLRIPSFSGSKKPSKGELPCLVWLHHVSEAVTRNKLNESAALDFLEMNATDAASTVLHDARREHMSYAGAVRQLEIRFAGLLHPHEALRQLEEMKMNVGENISDLHIRVRAKAMMATREDGPEALANETRLATTHFTRCLPERLQWTLQDAQRARRARGFEAHSYNELLDEVLRLHRQMNSASRARKAREKDPLFLVGEDGTAGIDEADEVTREDLFADEDEEPIPLLYTGASTQRRGAPGQGRGRGRGRLPQQQRVGPYDGGAGVRSGYALPSAPPAAESLLTPGDVTYLVTHDEQGLEAVFAIEPQPGKPPRSRRLDLKKLNVQRNECARCGLAGHMCSADSCPLTGKKITDDPCPICKKGGHLSTDCPRTSVPVAKNS